MATRTLVIRFAVIRFAAIRFAAIQIAVTLIWATRYVATPNAVIHDAVLSVAPLFLVPISAPIVVLTSAPTLVPISVPDAAIQFEAPHAAELSVAIRSPNPVSPPVLLDHGPGHDDSRAAAP